MRLWVDIGIACALLPADAVFVGWLLLRTAFQGYDFGSSGPSTYRAARQGALLTGASLAAGLALFSAFQLWIAGAVHTVIVLTGALWLSAVARANPERHSRRAGRRNPSAHGATSGPRERTVHLTRPAPPPPPGVAERGTWLVAELATTTEICLDAGTVQVFAYDADDGDPGRPSMGHDLTEYLGACDAPETGRSDNGDVAVIVAVLPRARSNDSAPYAPIADATLYASRGRLAVRGSWNGVPDRTNFELPPGWARIRMSRTTFERPGGAPMDGDVSNQVVAVLRIEVWPVPEPGAGRIYAGTSRL
ncbi:hypothetical protein ACIBI4_04660 [Streptomyces sp. NPDC050418]|uniref:hypothetical protein n=1 Tax=Streptomyces sp. NPDC050418 TaxID=3365612 RepID=UPI0037976054